MQAIDTQGSTIEVQLYTLLYLLQILPIQTPEQLQPRRSPTPESIPEHLAPPASTAPPKLGEEQGKGKRRRKYTARYYNAVKSGLLDVLQTAHTATASATLKTPRPYIDSDNESSSDEVV